MFLRKEYSVRLTGRAGLIYSEGPKTMRIDSELLTGPEFDIVIYRDSIRSWDARSDQELLSESDIGRIEANISASLSKMRIDWQ
jgi:hypothetical protein